MRHAVSLTVLVSHCRNRHRVFAILPAVNAWPDNDTFKTAWRDNPEEALAKLERMARHLGRTGDPETAVTVAKHHTRLGRPDQARRWLYPLLDYGNNGYVALHLANSFRFDERTEDFDEALGHAQRALTLARSQRDGALAHAALLTLGELMEATLEPKRALEYAGEAMGISEALGVDAASIEPLAALSRLHIKNGVRGKAEEQATRAFNRSHTAASPLQTAAAWMAVAYVRRDADAASRAVALATVEHHAPLQARALYLQALTGGEPTPDAPISATLYPALT